jgi:hypothetical protein
LGKAWERTGNNSPVRLAQESLPSACVKRPYNLAPVIDGDGECRSKPSRKRRHPTCRGAHESLFDAKIVFARDRALTIDGVREEIWKQGEVAERVADKALSGIG